MKAAAPRRALLFCLTALLAAVLAAPVATARTQRSSHQTGLENDVLVQLNDIRVAHGLVPLKLSPGLDAAATQHTREMIKLDYFAHDSADGTSFDARIARYYPFLARFHTWSVGENLVFSEPDLDAAVALRLWMASPPHRHNILDPDWREIGIAALHVTDAPSVFGGADVTVITTDFGARS
jgi:uncharacterized protein YkwD